MRGLIWLVLAGAFYWALHELFSKGLPQRGDPEKGSEEMVRDPQCGVYVPLGSAIRKKIRGEVVHFCSRECEDAFGKAGSVSAKDSGRGAQDV